jgi:hypothetical protein
MGDDAAARSLEEQVLAISREAFGERHPDTLRAMGNLAGTLSSMGDDAAARPLQEQVLAIRRGTLGDRHPDTLRAMGNLARTLSSMGDDAAARSLEQVFQSCGRLLGDDISQPTVSL